MAEHTTTKTTGAGDDPRQAQKDHAALITRWALDRWPTLTKSEQAGIRVGLFPYSVMQEGEQATGGTPRELARAFMDVAKAHGGMRA
jgi:hypothetical protein